MEFRRSGQSDQRRRRVLRDETVATPDEGLEAAPSRTRRSAAGSAASRGYSEAAHRERQPRVVDFLPTRLWTVWVLTLAGLVCVAMLAASHLHLPELRQLAGRGNLAAIDLAAPNSIGAWFSSLVFTLAAGWSLLIYSLRRHKVDDYRGRYRVWLPAAAALLLLSVDATTGLHRAVAGTIVRLSGVTTFGDGPIWPVTMYGFLLGTLGLRLAIEMRRSRPSVAAFCVAAACYGLSVPLSLGAWLPAEAVFGTLARSLLLLLGHLGIAASVGLYARHVYLDSQGRLTQRKAKGKKQKKTKSESSEEDDAEDKKPATTSANGKTRRIDGAHSEPPAPKTAQSGTPTGGQSKPAGPLASKMAAAPVGSSTSKFGDATQAKASATVSRQSDDDDDEDDEDGDDDDSRLSRAERKRLKKMQRRGAAGKY